MNRIDFNDIKDIIKTQDFNNKPIVSDFYINNDKTEKCLLILVGITEFYEEWLIVLLHDKIIERLDKIKFKNAVRIYKDTRFFLLKNYSNGEKEIKEIKISDLNLDYDLED